MIEVNRVNQAATQQMSPEPIGDVAPERDIGRIGEIDGMIAGINAQYGGVSESRDRLDVRTLTQGAPRRTRREPTQVDLSAQSHPAPLAKRRSRRHCAPPAGRCAA